MTMGNVADSLAIEKSQITVAYEVQLFSSIAKPRLLGQHRCLLSMESPQDIWKDFLYCFFGMIYVIDLATSVLLR